jgi:hypothetical protein
MVVEDWPIEVVVETVTDLPPLNLGAAPAETAETGEAPPSDLVTEEEVRAALRWVTDRLADLTGEPKDRAMEWELDLTAPGVTRMLNEWFPDVARQIKQWDPRRAGEWLPPWTGLLLMVLRRVAPRVLEGSVITWMDRIAGWLDGLWTGAPTHSGTSSPPASVTGSAVPGSRG